MKEAVEVHEYKSRHAVEKDAQIAFDKLVGEVVTPQYNPAGHFFYDVKVREGVS